MSGPLANACRSPRGQFPPDRSGTRIRVLDAMSKLRRSAMKPLAVILSLAILGIALSSGFSPASASKMDGKCCASSDGGRSYRYRMAVWRAAPPTHAPAAHMRTRAFSGPASGRTVCRRVRQRKHNVCGRESMWALTAAGSSLACRGSNGLPLTRRRIGVSIPTARELEFLVSLRTCWSRLYWHEFARLRKEDDGLRDAQHEAHSKRLHSKPGGKILTFAPECCKGTEN